MIKESEAWLFYMPKVWDILKVDYGNLSSEYVGVCFYNTFNFSISFYNKILVGGSFGYN